LHSIEIGRENYTSVVDLGQMMEKIYNGQCIGEKEDREMLGILLNQEDNDKIPALLPSRVKVAHKTGELVGAIHDGGIVFGEKQDYIVCIMSEHVTSVKAATLDLANFSEIIYRFLN